MLTTPLNSVRHREEDKGRFANEIESGQVELHSYSNESSLEWETESKRSQTSFGSAAKTKYSKVERKKGTPWTEEEYRVVLIENDIDVRPFTSQVLSRLRPLPSSVSSEDLASPIRRDIADVTNFVHPRTPLDDEATQRGTSVYLVERRIVMLPKPLTEEEMTPEPKIISTRFTKSVIKSCAALSYVEAQARMNDSHLMDPLTTDLRNMNVLAKVMRQRRIDRGALTLASAEVKFHIDTELMTLWILVYVATTMILTLGPVIDFLLANQNALEPRNINRAKQLKVREAEKNQCKDIVRSEKTVFKSKKKVANPSSASLDIYLNHQMGNQTQNERSNKSDACSPPQIRPPNTPTWCSSVDNIVKNTIFLLLSMTKEMTVRKTFDFSAGCQGIGYKYGKVMCTKYLQERKDLVQAFHKDIKLSDLPKITHKSQEMFKHLKSFLIDPLPSELESNAVYDHRIYQYLVSPLEPLKIGL
ncbi:unnamed protein product [Camellia sinensis]